MHSNRGESRLPWSPYMLMFVSTSEAAMAGKHIISNHLRTTPPSLRSSFSAFRRRLHESAYEKEVEYEVPLPPIEEKSQEYWEPDPETGVFVPASEQQSEEPAVTCTTEETVLDEKAFFRPLEDLEQPPPESFTGEIPPVDPFAEQ